MKSVFLITGLVASASSTLYLTRPNYTKIVYFEQNSIGDDDWVITKELSVWEIPG